uniref:SEA domain-containing protein n=2 Tax=Xiphophorus TaxID=8082 RepID=A0A3B5QR40_XIPMA
MSVCVLLRFVGPADNIYSCSFVQMLEQRLENAFEEAQDKVLETYNRLTVEIQSVSQESGSPSVTLVYVVKNQDAVLNGTISSGLLNQLTAELVGYFLFYPPLVIAERKYSFIFSQWDINLAVYLFHCIDCE